MKRHIVTVICILCALVQAFFVGVAYQKQKAALGDTDDTLLAKCFEIATECSNTLKTVSR